MRLAVVQFDFVPNAIAPNGRTWIPAEPLAWPVGSTMPDAPLSRLAALDPRLRTLSELVEPGLREYQRHRLKQILEHLESNAVGVCVFPEYALPCDNATLQILASFSQSMVIVAGLGVPKDEGVQALQRSFSVSTQPSSNIAVVLHEGNCRIVEKSNRAENEQIAPGSGISSFPVRIDGKSVTLGVAICMDYLTDGHSVPSLHPAPDLLAIPALSMNVKVFSPDAPRDFPRLFANHSAYGGSMIHASGCEGIFTSDGLAFALPAKAEGILAVDWHGPLTRPAAIRHEKNRVVLRSQILTESQGEEIFEIARAFQAAASNPEYADDGSIQRWLTFLDKEQSAPILEEAILAFRDTHTYGVSLPDSTAPLTQHLFASGTPSLDAYRQEVLSPIARHLRSVIAADDGEADPHLLAVAVEAYPLSRPRREAESEDTTRCHFSLSLGAFTEERAQATLESQQDLLRTFTRTAPAGSHVRFSMHTSENPATGVVGGHYSIAFIGASDDESTAYFAQLERIARPIFLRGWSVGSGREDRTRGERFRLHPSAYTVPRIREDLGVLIDVLRATGSDCAVEMVATPAVGEEPGAPPLATDNTRPAGLTSTNADGVFGWFNQQSTGFDRIGLGVEIVSPVRNEVLARTVGSILFDGPVELQAVPDDGPGVEGTSYPIEYAHRILHPPHGHIAGRGLSQRDALRVYLRDVPTQPEGALIGRATAARPFVDETVDVRIPEQSRRLHTYVLGRTGTGKTNTLKNLARHDIKRGGPVIVIDPHGDLYDYCLRHSAQRTDILALDFSSADPPSINPVYLDAKDEAGIGRNIDELVEIFVHASHHQFAGPRFSDMMRLCLETLVALTGSGEKGWLGLRAVPELIENRKYREESVNGLKKLGRDDLVRRWTLHSRMLESQQAEVEQWFISKFGEFRRSDTFARATAGLPEIELHDTLRNGGVVLLKIPRATLGEAASGFLGGLVVERVFRYTLDGVFQPFEHPGSLIVDEFQHFVGSSFERLVPEARKFNLGLTVANQTLSQLRQFSKYEGYHSDSLFQILIGNVGNLIIQGIGRQDAKVLAPEVDLREEQLLRIDKFGAVVQLTVNWERSAAFTVKMKDSGDYPSDVSEEAAEAAATESLRAARASAQPPMIAFPTPQQTPSSDDDKSSEVSRPGGGAASEPGRRFGLNKDRPSVDIDDIGVV